MASIPDAACLPNMSRPAKHPHTVPKLDWQAKNIHARNQMLRGYFGQFIWGLETPKIVIFMTNFERLRQLTQLYFGREYIVFSLEAHLDFLEIAAYGSITDEMGRKMCKCISMDRAMSGGQLSSGASFFCFLKIIVEEISKARGMFPPQKKAKEKSCQLVLASGALALDVTVDNRQDLNIEQAHDCSIANQQLAS